MTTAVDQEAIRVANRYASLIEKATTLTARARACETAAQQYRADARANQESADNHRQTARTIHNPALSHQHAEAARDAEAEAAREILAARMYEIQAETYVAQAHGAGGPSAGGTTRAVLDAPHRTPGHYDGAARPVPSGAAATKSSSDNTGKEAMTASDAGALPDTARLTEKGGDHWHGSDVLTPASGDATVALGLCQYPNTGPFVVLATNPAGHQWAPDSTTNGIDPALSPREAGQVADTLDELAALAESGTQVKPLTRLEKVAARVRDLIGTTGVNIAGDDGEIEVSAADMRAILDAAVPEPTVVTRRKVVAKAAEDAGMDSGAVWAELDTSGPEPVVTLTTTEGDPPEDYPEGYTPARLSPTEARQLADTVRRFAAPETPTAPTADRASMVAGQLLALTDRIRQRADHGVSDEQVDALFDGLSVAELKQVAEATGMPAGYLQRTRQDLIHYVRLNTVETALTARSIASVRIVDRHTAPPATPAPAAVPDPAVEQVRAQSEAAAPAPAPAGPRRVTSPAGRVYEVDPDSGQTAIIEPDGWRAVVPPTSTIGVAARLLDWRNEIKQGRGQDATADGARAMLATMTAFELREVAEAIGTTVPASRTKAQLVDAIVNSAVSSPLKHRGLAQGWW